MKKLLAKRWFRAIGIFFGLLLLGFMSTGVFRWRPGRRAEPPRLESVAHGAGVLTAGAAEVSLHFPRHVPVAGYPRLAWYDRGIRDPVSVRALVLSEPGCSVALVSVEIMLVPGKLARAVEKRVRNLGLDGVVVAATHTHSGPGGYWNDAVSERIGTGPYDSRIFDSLVDEIAEAVRRAADTRAPAYLSVARARWPTYARNRAGKGERIDGHLVDLSVSDQAGKPLAEVVIFPAHAAILDLENHRISGDWPGHLMRAGSGVRLFFQGAVGDQSPKLPNDGPIPVPEIYARALATHLSTLTFSTPDPWPPLSAAFVTALLPEADPGAAPPFFKRLATNLLYNWVPARGRVGALRVGPALLLLVPGEPVADVAEQWRTEVGSDAEILSLASDYLGYIETTEHIAEQLGETPRTYFGPELAGRIGTAVQVAARAALEEPKDAP